MDKQDAKRIGNQHSPLLAQLIKAAEGVKSKEVTPFKDTIIKIASDTPPSLKETLAKIAVDTEKRTRFMKQAQFDTPPTAEPDFDGMAAGGSPELGDTPMGDTPMEEYPDEEPGGDMEEAKQHLADALVSLCGGVDEAMECLQSSGDIGDELEMGEELGDDMVPSELLGGEPEQEPEPAPADMMKPMVQEPMTQEPSLMGQNPIKQTPLM